MSVVEFLAAVETVGRHKSTLLHLVEDTLDIYEIASGDIEAEAGSTELLDKERYVKLVAVESCDVAVIKKVMQRLCYLAEGRGILYVIICNMMDGCAFLRYMSLGIDPTGLLFGVSVREDLNERDLDYTVGCDTRPGSLQIEKDNWAYKVKLHYDLLLRKGLFYYLHGHLQHHHTLPLLLLERHEESRASGIGKLDYDLFAGQVVEHFQHIYAVEAYRKR